MISLRNTLGWLPVALLLAGAANHFWQVRQHRISPWLGGGFGMFASSDVGSTRLVVVTALTRDGKERPIRLREPLRETEDRARGLPGPTQLQALADATRQAIEEGGTGLNPDDLSALRVEVWRTRFDPETLRPRQTRIAGALFDYGNYDD